MIDKDISGQPANTSGFDACVPIGRVVGGLKAAGVDFVILYGAPGQANAWKVTTPDAAVELAIAGIALVVVYETNGDPTSAADGVTAGNYLRDFLPSLGLFPGTGVVVELTVDRDCDPSDVAGPVAAFTAVMVDDPPPTAVPFT